MSIKQPNFFLNLNIPTSS